MLFPVDPSMFEAHLTLQVALAFVLVALAASVATAIRPMFGCAALLAADPFEFGHYSGTTFITFPKVALAGVVLGLIVYYGRSADARAKLRGIGPARMLVAALALLAAANALSFLQADFHFIVWDELIKLRDYAGFFVAALAAGIADDDLRPFHVACVIVLAVVALLAIVQEAGGASSVVPMGGVLVPRVAGPLEGPNQLAAYLQILIPALAASAVFRGARIWDLGVLAIASCCDVLTLSRNGFLCGVVAVAIVLFFAPGKRWAVVAALAAGTACGAAVRPESFMRFTSAEQNENARRVGTRRILWQAAYDLWRAHPFLGIGAGNFELEISRVGPAGVRTHANDWYIQALVEGGIPLLGATLFTVYAATASFVRDLRRDPVVLAAFGVSAGLALASILDYALFYPKVADMWWLLLGLASARQALLRCGTRPGTSAAA